MAAHQLFVLRHAKSSWDDPGLDDRDRPLAPRGRRAVERLARHLEEGGISPQQVLCSPARRTVETMRGIGPRGEELIEPELYGASGDQVLDRLRRVPEPVGSVMVVGHNPAMQVVVLRLTGAARGGVVDSPDLSEVRRKFPTGALATLSFDCPWSELGPGCASLTAYARPKTLH